MSVTEQKTDTRVMYINACSIYKYETHRLGKAPVNAAIVALEVSGVIPITYKPSLDDCNTLHDAAMEYADKIDHIKRRLGKSLGNLTAKTYAIKALELERLAAQCVPADMEPTRSILFSSAAFLAIESGQPEEAKRLIDCAFEGKPEPHTIMRLNEALALIK